MPPFDFSDFLEERPQELYQSFLTDPGTKMPSSMRRYYQNQFTNIQNEYIGELTRQMREGKTPTRTFQNFLSEGAFKQPTAAQASGSGMSRFTGAQRFMGESPYTRSTYGAGPMRQNTYAPSARWITY
jgi:hypothetical protein